MRGGLRARCGGVITRIANIRNGANKSGGIATRRRGGSGKRATAARGKRGTAPRGKRGAMPRSGVCMVGSIHARKRNRGTRDGFVISGSNGGKAFFVRNISPGVGIKAGLRGVGYHGNRGTCNRCFILSRCSVTT